jgi:hypothetical protein
MQFRGGDALQRMPPAEGRRDAAEPAVRRADRGGRRGALRPRARGGRERRADGDGGDFFTQLATHWKKNYAGWTAWVLTPDLKLPTRMRLKESRRVPMWNGPIECRLFRFDMVAGSARTERMPSLLVRSSARLRRTVMLRLASRSPHAGRVDLHVAVARVAGRAVSVSHSARASAQASRARQNSSGIVVS